MRLYEFGEAEQKEIIHYAAVNGACDYNGRTLEEIVATIIAEMPNSLACLNTAVLGELAAQIATSYQLGYYNAGVSRDNTIGKKGTIFLFFEGEEYDIAEIREKCHMV